MSVRRRRRIIDLGFAVPSSGPFRPVLAEEFDRMGSPDRATAAAQIVGRTQPLAAPADPLGVFRAERKRVGHPQHSASSAPSASIPPTGSWPMINPGVTWYSPLAMCTSVPQMVVAVLSLLSSTGSPRPSVSAFGSLRRQMQCRLLDPLVRQGCRLRLSDPVPSARYLGPPCEIFGAPASRPKVELASLR
jgi:hypothetical protein